MQELEKQQGNSVMLGTYQRTKITHKEIPLDSSFQRDSKRSCTESFITKRDRPIIPARTMVLINEVSQCQIPTCALPPKVKLTLQNTNGSASPSHLVHVDRSFLRAGVAARTSKHSSRTLGSKKAFTT